MREFDTKKCITLFTGNKINTVITIKYALILANIKDPFITIDIAFYVVNKDALKEFFSNYNTFAGFLFVGSIELLRHYKQRSKFVDKNTILGLVKLDTSFQSTYRFPGIYLCTIYLTSLSCCNPLSP